MCLRVVEGRGQRSEGERVSSCTAARGLSASVVGHRRRTASWTAGGEPGEDNQATSNPLSPAAAAQGGGPVSNWIRAFIVCRDA